MEDGSRSSRQNLTLENVNAGPHSKKKSGLFLTTPTLLFVCALFVAVLIGVGLIVFFSIPPEKCETGAESQSQSLQSCKRYIQRAGRDAVCSIPPEVSDKEKEAKMAEDLKKGLRLNTSVVPIHYDLEFWPRFYEDDNFTFTGQVTILITCKEPTDVIVLHIDQLSVDRGSLMLRDSSGAVLGVNSTIEDKPRQFYKIYPQMKLKKEKDYSLTMNFNGTVIHDDWMGLYRSSYKENNITHWLVLTQFETTSARRAFPCFDESYFKATFTLTIVRRNDHIAISNTPVQRTESREGVWDADIFERSPRMSPYLVAFSVNLFKYVESYTPEGVRIRTYTRPSYIKYAEYANQITAKILQAYVDWTGIPYTLQKLDQLAAPDFAAGAMENWGLVTYREITLLYNANFSSIGQKRYIANIIAHELAHQWFGNMVTCQWWDDIFLNEAFATYLGHHIGIKAAEPQWEDTSYFMYLFEFAMKLDGRHNSQPIRLPNLEHHDGLKKAFSVVAYYKGASILRMIKDFLGETTFRDALQKYLRTHQFEPVVKDDLYQAFQEQAELDFSVTWDTQKTNLSRILTSWFDQQNFPLVTASDLGDGSLKVTQSHFVYKPDKNISYPTPLGSEFLWDIPLTYADSSSELQFTWMLRSEKEKRLPGLATSGWKVLNLERMGFYRVKYGDENWNRILYQLAQNHTVFSVDSRAAFIDDAFQIAKAGEMDEVDALRSTEYLKSEKEYLPWNSAIKSRMHYYRDMLFNKPVYDDLETYLANLLVPIYNSKGWTVSKDPNSILERYWTVSVLGNMCKMNYKPCVDKAQDLFDQFMNDPSVNPIHPDLRQNVYCIGVSRGGMKEWNFLKSRNDYDYGDVFVAYEKMDIEKALACATLPHAIRRYLDYSLSKNSSAMFSVIAKRRFARDTVWNYITERWDEFTDGNKTRISKPTILKAVTSTWNTKGDIRKMQDFRAVHNESKLEETYGQIEETIHDNMAWVETNLEPLQQWLQAVNSGATYIKKSVRRRRRRSAAPDEDWHVDSDFNIHQMAAFA